MLRYLPHHEINEKSWDDCVAASSEKIIYAYSWFLNTVCKRWDAVVEEQQGKYVSVFPLPLGERWGQLGVLQPYFTQQLGLFTTSQSKYKSITSYLKLIPEKYKRVQLQLNTVNAAQESIPLAGFEATAKVTYHLPLQAPYEAILKNYRNRHKLNKALRSELQVKPLEDIGVLIGLFKQTKGQELSEIKEKHYKLLARLYSVLRSRGLAELVQVTNKAGHTLATGLFAHQPDKIIFVLSAANEEGRRTAAMTLLINSCIQKYAGSNRIFDFEGSMAPSVAKFYASFGATPVTYVSLNRHFTPWYLLWKKAISSS